ncbi:TMEM205 protein [Hibiscus syriacus]|uniref:TMEM205 protein n=1 Tax=Hibiscus syriacus TaxID=106335 RepID=A0A6A2WML0_HIBSY|nr:TMEM205 protein [Hibiscus syriacus]
MAVSPCLSGNDQKKHWWLTKRKLVDKYIKDAKRLVATQGEDEIASALNLLDAALALSPSFEIALELKARSLLYLRHFRDVVDMLQDYIPSLKMSIDDSVSVSSDNSSQHLSREGVMLLPSRFMEDAMVLLQTGRRLASAAFCCESICWSDDSFSLQSAMKPSSDISAAATTPPQNPTSPSELENISQLLSHIKLLIRRRTAAMATLDAGLYSETIRHFSKIIDGHRRAPQGFLVECYMHREYTYKASGRITESISDCNKTLALDPTCIEALDTRASLLETIREQERAELLLQSLPDSYDQLIINLTNSNVTSLVFDDVAIVVLQEENRRKNKEDKQVNLQQAEVLTTMTTMRGRSTERGQSISHKHGRSKSRSKKNLKCYSCGKKGHLKKDCWSLNKNSNPQGNTANTSDDGDALCCEASTTVEGRKRFADIWLIDSGVTYHMTSRRE